MTKEIKKNEFRKANDKKHGEHPTYIYAQEGKKLKFIGITHSHITDGMENIPLEKIQNPEIKAKLILDLIQMRHIEALLVQS